MKKIFQYLTLSFLFLVFTCFPQQPGWELIPTGTSANLNSVHFIDPFDVYVCGEELLNISSADSGSTWQITSISTPVTLNDIYIINSSIIVAVGSNGTVFRTIDGGNNWNASASGVSDNLLSVSFFDSLGICGALSQTIVYTSNNGADWSIAQSGFFGGGFWGAVMLSPEIGFVAGENSIFQPLLGMTTDSGQNWSFSAFYLNNNEGRATGVDFTDIFIGYVSASVWDGRGAIAKTTNSGSDWVTTFFNNPLWDIDFPVSATGLIGYAVGDSGTIYKTYDAGLNWQPQQSGTSAKLNGVQFLDLDYGFAVGENGTLLRTTTGGEPVTQVSENSSRFLDFKLEQNYPNPFNPSTKIKFTIPTSPLNPSPYQGEGNRERFVTLKVYDVLGNEIATLVNEELQAGEYEVTFDPASIIENPASGIYFYQLKSGSFIQTKKMVLMK